MYSKIMPMDDIGVNMKNIAIYGAGDYGKSVVKILQNTKHICITIVCDSDNNKWGKNWTDFVISPPSKLFEEEKLDGVFISILSDNDIDKYILSKRNIKIYKKIYELVAETIYWDISGKCNAKCKYCVTGRNNRKHDLNYVNSYLSFQSFKNNYEHLYEKGIISKESRLCFFNWKEPFLNPDILDILNYCSKEGQNYLLSTNGSVVKMAIDKNTYSKCEQIAFSMPGFSQESYDRIHGFAFEAIKKNIITIKKDMLEHGFKGRFTISAHIYKFSENEMKHLKDWAKEEGIFVNAYYPYLAGNTLIADYFENRLEEEEKNNISSELFLQWKDEIPQEHIRNFENPLCNQLTFDEKGNITLCCMADEFCDNFIGWGKIEDLTSYEDYKELKKKMLNSKTCIQCRKYEMAYRVLQINQ